MSKDLRYGVLLDFYAFMLTEKQAIVLDQYYNDDLSLSEIADETGITRQAAMDFVRRGSEKLARLEDHLKLSEKFTVVSAALREAKEYCENSENPKLAKTLESAIRVWEDA